MPLASNSGAASGGMLASQEHLDDLRLFHRSRQLAFEDFLAGIEHDDAVGDVLDEAHEMLDHDNRNPACGKRLMRPAVQSSSAGLSPAASSSSKSSRGRVASARVRSSIFCWALL